MLFVCHPEWTLSLKSFDWHLELHTQDQTPFEAGSAQLQRPSMEGAKAPYGNCSAVCPASLPAQSSTVHLALTTPPTGRAKPDIAFGTGTSLL